VRGRAAAAPSNPLCVPPTSLRAMQSPLVEPNRGPGVIVAHQLERPLSPLPPVRFSTPQPRRTSIRRGFFFLRPRAWPKLSQMFFRSPAKEPAPRASFH
jgi:hypothetical protein